MNIWKTENVGLISVLFTVTAGSKITGLYIINARWGDEILRACPDRPRVPPSTLGIGFVLELKRLGWVADYQSLLVPRLRMGLSYIFSSFLCFHRHVIGNLYLLHVRLNCEDTC